MDLTNPVDATLKNVGGYFYNGGVIVAHSTNGYVAVAKKEIKRVAAQVDVTTFSSGNSNRDSHAMEVIDAISYPDSRFSSTAVRQTADSVYVTGMLTFHGVTKEVVIAAVTSWQSEKVVIAGGFDVSLTAFNIERPSLLMIPVDDTLRFSLLAVYRIEQPHI